MPRPIVSTLALATTFALGAAGSGISPAWGGSRDPAAPRAATSIPH
jgi:hypothetical protein